MRTTDVAVVGAGPAGWTATLTAASLGANVTLIDEAKSVGGHLRWSIEEHSGIDDMPDGMRGFQIARWAHAKLHVSTADIVLRGVVWGLFSSNVLAVASQHASYELRANRVILATGSTDIVHPFPGWELPGVMTARAALRMMHIHRVLPAQRVAIVGLDFSAHEVSRAVELAGGTVVAQLDPDIEFSAGGNSRVEWVEQDGSRVAADAVVIALGVQPDPELALQAQVEIGYSSFSGCHVPLRSETLETSVPGLFVAGEAAGICSLAEAIAEGRVAAVAALESDGIEEALSALQALRSEKRTIDLESLCIAGADAQTAQGSRKVAT